MAPTTGSSIAMHPLSTVFDASPIATLAYSASFTIVDVNDAAEAALGGDRRQIIGRHGLDFVESEEREVVRAGLAVFLSDPTREMPSIVPLAVDGRPAGSYVVHLRAVEPPRDNVAYVGSLVPADHLVADNRLIDAVVSGEGLASVLRHVVLAIEARKLFGATFHVRANLTVGRFDRVVRSHRTLPIEPANHQLELTIRDAADRHDARFVRLDELGLRDDVVQAAEADPSAFRALWILPIEARGDPVGALVIWTRRTDEIGPLARVWLERIRGIASMAIEADLRRREQSAVRELGGLTLDIAERVAYVGDRRVALTPAECTILALLADTPGQTVSREAMAQQIWGSAYVGNSRACDVHVKNLRQKLETGPLAPEIIVTVRGHGYLLRPPA